MTPVALFTDRLVLDQPTGLDVDTITDLLQEPVFARYLRELPLPYRRRDAVDFVTRFVPEGWRREREQTWAIRRDGEFIGVIGARLIGLRDVGFWLGAPHRGQGFLGEALGAVLAHRFASGCEIVRWECVAGNLPSARAAHRAGFAFTGERPATRANRDGLRLPSWFGELRASDDRTPKPGWPPLR